jgi:hypothetical protein
VPSPSLQFKEVFSFFCFEIFSFYCTSLDVLDFKKRKRREIPGVVHMAPREPLSLVKRKEGSKKKKKRSLSLMLPSRSAKRDPCGLSPLHVLI